MEAHRLLLSMIVFGAVVGMLFVGKASITGFVPTAVASQELDINVYESQRYILSSPEISQLGSFALSGYVTGPGLVNVYLSDGATRLLAFSNKKKPGSSMEHITAMATLDIETNEMLNEIETLPAGYITGSGVFRNGCEDTCIIDEHLLVQQPLYLDIIVETGTSLHISEILFSTGSE